ncbi:MAG: tyrosine-type recombinase/integrase [Candidatus Loosdrechtia sp.]|uniref:tyrosine-type recombinase/integrase n=1 Tax=Candidatus Loosdrechtia sp. TaxID=3101272 RepID=UPI003A77C041|nr:MAG: site-specific integrase [Candidatus Jettenia sp. AMX2]
MLTGCRLSEGRALRCGDVNLKDSTIRISSTFSGNVFREKRKGRGAKSVTIPIHPELLSFLKERVESNLPHTFVFVSELGKHYSRSKLDRIWNIVKKKTNLPDNVRMYDATRHSFASQLVNQGVPLLSVSRLMGHFNTKITERYSHSDLERLKIDVSNLTLQDKIVRLEKGQKVENI